MADCWLLVQLSGPAVHSLPSSTATAVQQQQRQCSNSKPTRLVIACHNESHAVGPLPRPLRAHLQAAQWNRGAAWIAREVRQAWWVGLRGWGGGAPTTAACPPAGRTATLLIPSGNIGAQQARQTHVTDTAARFWLTNHCGPPQKALGAQSHATAAHLRLVRHLAHHAAQGHG